MDLKDRFETETGQGIAFNEGKEPEENNGTYNDAYVEWLENLILFGVGIELPTKEEELSEVERLINKYLHSYTKDIRNGFSLGFTNGVNWLKSKMKDNGN